MEAYMSDDRFSVGDTVTWSCLTGRSRKMDPACLQLMLDVCQNTGAQRYKVSKVVDLSEGECKAAGHTQSLIIANPKNGEDYRLIFSGFHFVKI